MVTIGSLNGFRQILRKFDEDGRLAVATHWSMARGGYDRWWEIYYDNIPVINCIAGTIENCCLDDPMFERLKGIILEEYDDLRRYN